MSKNRDVYISMDKLAVGYNGKAIIKDICIDINKGEIVTLIGPNGAGKSTILKSITRQLSLIGGKVWFGEKNLHKMSSKEVSTKMAVVLTERLKAELMTCYDIVASGRYPYTGKLGRLTEEDERKVDEAIAAVHAAEIGPKDFNAISDGQKQRVLLARAICQDPEIIVLDEPTSYLDIRHKLELLGILKNLAVSRKMTVVMSLHEIDLAMKVSDRILCVKGDRIPYYGSPEEIFSEDKIRSLFDIEGGSFDPLFGSIELGRIEGAPEVFVLSSCGSGIPVYRQLQKQKIPFAAGILYTNDVDYQLARLLAVQVITAKPFTEITDDQVEAAAKVMQSCRAVVNAGVEMGEYNKKMNILIRRAAEMKVAGLDSLRRTVL